MIKGILKTAFLLLCAGMVALTLISCGDVDDEILTVELSADSTEIPADGASSAAITATLTNERGEPALQGTDVQFIADPLGTFSNGKDYITISTPDDTGEVTVPLISEKTAGDTLVTATANDVTQTITITFAPLE